MADDVKLLEHDMAMAKGCAHGRREGLTGRISRKALFNAVRSEGIGVLTPDGKGYWDDMKRRYPHLNLNGGQAPTGCNLKGTVNRLGKVTERFRGGRWEHVERGEWVPGEVGRRVGIAR